MIKIALIKDVTRTPGIFKVEYDDRDELDEYESSQQFRILSFDYYKKEHMKLIINQIP